MMRSLFVALAACAFLLSGVQGADAGALVLPMGVHEGPVEVVNDTTAVLIKASGKRDSVFIEPEFAFLARSFFASRSSIEWHIVAPRWRDGLMIGHMIVTDVNGERVAIVPSWLRQPGYTNIIISVSHEPTFKERAAQSTVVRDLLEQEKTSSWSWLGL